MFQKFYEFNRSSIFYKMHENFPSMRVREHVSNCVCLTQNWDLEGLDINWAEPEVNYY